MCVLHATAWAANPGGVSKNVKVFTAVRDDAAHPEAANFGAFRLIGGPFGNSGFANDNPGGLPSVYGVSEAWLPGAGFNEALRAESVPVHPSGVGATGGSEWLLIAQDFTGAWRVPTTPPTYTFTTPTDFEPGQLDQENNDVLPRWMPVGVARPQMFACAGELTENGAQRTTWLMEAIPRGTGANPTHVNKVQDVLNGDTFFRAVPDTVLAPGATAAPTPSITGPAPAGHVSPGIVSCAITQTADDSTSRALHVIAVNNRELLYATLSNYGPVTQQTSNGVNTFNRFRTVSGWVEVLGLFPTDFGELVHVSALATGSDQLLHVFFVGKRNAGGSDVFRLWHTKRSANGNWSTPVDVLSASGGTSTGTPYDMPISASFCPAFGDNLGTQPGAEILLTFYIPDTNSIIVQQVTRTAKVWVPGRAASVYSNWMVVPQAGVSTGLATLRVRLSTRPFNDM